MVDENNSSVEKENMKEKTPIYKKKKGMVGIVGIVGILVVVSIGGLWSLSSDTNDTLLDEVLISNAKFVEEFDAVDITSSPQKKLAVVTCMDTRLSDGFVEQALGIKRGDAKIVRNAGCNALVDRDVTRSVAAAIYALGAEEVIVVGHSDCGMAGADADALKEAMIAQGISENEIAKVDLGEWIGAIETEESNVIASVENIKNSPFIPNNIPIHGLIIDPITGKLNLLVNGYT